MTRLRALPLRHNMLALWVGMAMLCMRVLVPTGFMPVVDARGMTLQICPGMVVQAAPPATHPAMAGHEATPEHPSGLSSEHHSEHQGQPDQPCGFAGLAMPAMGGTDPIALIPVRAEQLDAPGTGIGQVAVAHAHLRPPPIGPPSTA